MKRGIIFLVFGLLLIYNGINALDKLDIDTILYVNEIKNISSSDYKMHISVSSISDWQNYNILEIKAQQDFLNYLYCSTMNVNEIRFYEPYNIWEINYEGNLYKGFVKGYKVSHGIGDIGNGNIGVICDSTIDLTFISDNKKLTGSIEFRYGSNKDTNKFGYGVGKGFIVIETYRDKYYDKKISDLELNQSSILNVISILESWKQSTNNWKTTIDSWKISSINTTNTIQILLTGHTNKIDILFNKTINQESRIKQLENKTCSCQINQSQIPNYFKYLSSSDRKNIVCGYAIDNHLNKINDLGFNCNITYTPTRTGERSYCKCVGK